MELGFVISTTVSILLVVAAQCVYMFYTIKLFKLMANRIMQLERTQHMHTNLTGVIAPRT